MTPRSSAIVERPARRSVVCTSWNVVLCPTVVEQGVDLTGRNRTGPPCSVGHPTAHAPGCRPARPPAAPQTTRRRRQTRDAIEQNSTGPLAGPVIMQTDRVSAWWTLSARVTFYSATCIVLYTHRCKIASTIAQRVCDALCHIDITLK